MKHASKMGFAIAHLLAASALPGWTSGERMVAFSRITHGWTNYSTAFNATQDTGLNGGDATVASFHTATRDVLPAEYAVIVIAGGTKPVDFGRFQFRVALWSGLSTFIQEPRFGDVATWDFDAATGGSPVVPDATTRGGRAAYQLRFALTNGPALLKAGGGYLVGFAARADTQVAGDLFVPTSSLKVRRMCRPAISSLAAGSTWSTPEGAPFTQGSLRLNSSSCQT